jgi:DNA sulfur modification protein DndB
MYGAAQDKHTFNGVMHASQLFAFAPNPLKMERVSKGKADEPDIKDVSMARIDVQRMFDGAKKRNVPIYADYIRKTVRGQIDGVTPVIELWTQSLLPDGNSPFEKIIPWGTQFISIDGESQLAARYLASADEPLLRNVMVSVRVHHGRTVEWAQQAFHDFNALAVKPNTAVAITMDQRNPLTLLARTIEDRVPQLHGHVHHTARQLGTNDPQLVTIATLRTAVVTFVAGAAGIQTSFRLSDDDRTIPPLSTQRAVDWFRAVFDRLGAHFKSDQRKLYVTPGPAAMAAIGVYGHRLLETPSLEMTDEQIAAQINGMVNELAAVDWSRGPHWVGIAGSITPKGAFSTAGGVKEHTYGIVKALTDQNSAEYYLVRKQAVPAHIQAEVDRQSAEREAARTAQLPVDQVEEGDEDIGAPYDIEEDDDAA